MNPQALQGAVAAAAVIGGWWVWGWQGLALAASAITFTVLLQFTRAMRALRHAALQPVGHVASVRRLLPALHHGMSLHEVIALTGSLGRRTGPGGGEDWLWRDDGGSELVVSLRRGRVVRWSVAAAADAAAVQPAPQADAPTADAPRPHVAPGADAPQAPGTPALGQAARTDHDPAAPG